MIKKLFRLVFVKKEKSYTNENEIISEFIPQEEITNLIQEDLTFIKSENKSPSKKIAAASFLTVSSQRTNFCSLGRLSAAVGAPR